MWMSTKCHVNLGSVDDIDRLLAVACLGDTKSSPDQTLADGVAKRRIVIGDQQIGDYEHGVVKCSGSAMTRHTDRERLSRRQANHDYHDSCNFDAIDEFRGPDRTADEPTRMRIRPVRRPPPIEPQSSGETGPEAVGRYAPALPWRRSATPAAVSDLAKRIIGNVEQAIVGKRKQLVLSLVTWLSGGHISAGGRPGRRQDDVGPGAGSQRRLHNSNASSARPICCRPT